MAENDSEFQPVDSNRLEVALGRFDQENAHDPNQLEFAGGTHPRELLYSQWLTDWVLCLEPKASEPLRLAARAQHLCRWEIARSSFPMTRAGYLQWREELKKFHAQKAGEILRDVGYPQEVIARVQDLVLKKNFPRDAEGRALEDALCLVFLEHQFAELAAKSPEEKMVSVLQKTWKKMTPKAQAAGLALPYGEKEKRLIDQALRGEIKQSPE